MPKIRPLFERVLVKRDEADGVTKGGIILPDQAKEKPVRGKVVAIGKGNLTRDGKERIPMDVKEGDTVTFQPYAGHEVEVLGEKFLIINQQEIMAVIEP